MKLLLRSISIVTWLLDALNFGNLLRAINVDFLVLSDLVVIEILLLELLVKPIAFAELVCFEKG